MSRKKLIFTICLRPRESARSKNVATDNVSEASTRRRAQGRLSVACSPSQENVRKHGIFRPSRSKCTIFVTFPSCTETACARNAEPGNESELLCRYATLFVLPCLYGRSQKRLACPRFSAPLNATPLSLPRLSEAQRIAAKKKLTLALAKACFSDASSQRGDSENSEVLSRSLT